MPNLSSSPCLKSDGEKISRKVGEMAHGGLELLGREAGVSVGVCGKDGLGGDGVELALGDVVADQQLEDGGELVGRDVAVCLDVVEAKGKVDLEAQGRARREHRQRLHELSEGDEPVGRGGSEKRDEARQQ